MKKNNSFNELNDARLLAAAAFARRGKRFADIGTDHAYLPVYLCGNGISPGGIASDINKGPIERARANIAAAGLEDSIVCRLADGLAGCEEYAPEDIFILGMGGELISQIIDAAPFVRKENIRLILQPMTHPEELRRYLLNNGFSIDDETVVTDRPVPVGADAVPFRTRIYQIICASYHTSEDSELTEAELLLGKKNIAENGIEVRSLALRFAANIANAVKGLESAGLDATSQKALESDLRRIAAGKN